MSPKPNASSRTWNAASRAETGGDLPPPEIVAGEAERKTGAWTEMWSAAYRGRTIMLVIFNLFQTIGYYGFSSWVPALLISQGIGVTRSLAYTFIIAIAAPVGPLIGDLFRRPFRAQMADRLGRDRHCRVRAVVCAADHRRRRHRVRSPDHVLQQLAVVFVSRLSGGALSDPHPRPGGRLRLFVEPVFSAIFSGFIIAFFLGRYGTIGVFGFIAGAMVIVFVVIGLFGPAVTNRRLEAIAG